MKVLKDWESFFKSSRPHAEHRLRDEAYWTEFLKGLTLLLLVFNVGLLVLNPFTYSISEWIFLLLASSMICMSLLSISKIFPIKKLDKQIVILSLFLFHSLWFIEYHLNHKLNHEGDTVHNMIQTMITGLALSRISLKKLVTVQILILIYSVARLCSNSDERNYFALICYFLNSAWSLWCAINIERYNRSYLEEREKQLKSLQIFKSLLINDIPVGVVICQHRDIVFFNNFSLNLLSAENEKKIIEKLSELRFHVNNSRSPFEQCSAKDLQDVELAFKKPDRSPLIQEKFPISDHNEGCADFDLGDFQQLKSGNAYLAETTLENTQKKYLEVKIQTINWDEEPSTLILITEEKAFEAKIKFNELIRRKDLAMASAMHDIRSPLNGILGTFDILAQENRFQEFQTLLESAKVSAELLMFLVKDLLDFSLIAEGKFQLSLEKFSLIECVKSVIQLILVQARSKDVCIRLETPIKDSAFIYSDQNRLKQILINLIGNSLKFTEKGTILINIENTECSGEFGYNIAVKDTGCGISEADIPLLFNEFSTIKNDTTTRLNKHGIGLGLSICQKLVKALNPSIPNQKISIHSIISVGSEFSFSLFNFKNEERGSDLTHDLPEGIGDMRERDLSSEQLMKRIQVSSYKFLSLKAENPVGIKPHNCLIVDDDLTNVFVLTSYLKGISNINIEKCTNGKQALRLIKEKAKNKIFFDLIFMDCKMPVMDGYTAARKIKQMVNEGVIPDLIIIAATAGSSKIEINQCIDSGMLSVLEKPFSKARFMKVLMDIGINYS